MNKFINNLEEIMDYVFAPVVRFVKANNKHEKVKLSQRSIFNTCFMILQIIEMIMELTLIFLLSFDPLFAVIACYILPYRYFYVGCYYYFDITFDRFKDFFLNAWYNILFIVFFTSAPCAVIYFLCHHMIEDELYRDVTMYSCGVPIILYGAFKLLKFILYTMNKRFVEENLRIYEE